MGEVFKLPATRHLFFKGDRAISPLITDSLIIGILLFSAIIAFMRGFVKEVLTIFSLVAASFASFVLGGKGTDMVKSMTSSMAKGDKNLVWGMIPHEIFVLVVSYGAVFILAFILFSVLSHFIGKAVQGVGLGAVDRTLGFVFGLARGLVILALINIPVLALMGDSEKPKWISDAKTMIFVDRTSEAIMEFDPSGFIGEKEKTVIKIEKSEEDLKVKIEDKKKNSKTGYSDKDRDSLNFLIEEIE